MTYLARHRDLHATLIAATATLLTVLFNPQTEQTARSQAPSDVALEGLIDAEQAGSEGAWLLDVTDVAPKLSFAPQYDRLVWRVAGPDADVLLDAKTGEALEFQFE